MAVEYEQRPKYVSHWIRWSGILGNYKYEDDPTADAYDRGRSRLTSNTSGHLILGGEDYGRYGSND